MATVLVVEDNADLRDMYEEILVLDGHSVRVAETAAEALNAVSAAPPDVVLLDLGIAGGTDALMSAVRAHEGARVVLASGARDLSERAAQLGAAAYLTKPFLPEDLLKVLERVLS